MIRLCLTFLFIIHGYINLERELFVNEMFAFLGLLLAGAYFLAGRGLVSKVDFSWLLLFVYGFGSFLFFGLIGNSEAGLYNQLRTLPIWYSMGGFFFGFYIIYGSSLYMKNGGPLWGLSMFLGGKLSPPAMFALVSSLGPGFGFRKKIILIAAFVTCMALVKYALGDHDGTTTIAVFLLFLTGLFFFGDAFFRLMRGRAIYYSIVFFFSCFLLFLNWVYSSFTDFYYIGFEYFGGALDVNAVWRLMFWAKSVGELQGIENLFGIGLGTPLFDVQDSTSAFINESDAAIEDRSYVLGLHNSFLTFLVRLGPIGLFLLFYIIKSIFQSLSSIDNDSSRLLLVANVLMCLAACFNVVLESSLYAGFFWALLGFSYRYVLEFRNGCKVKRTNIDCVGAK